MKTGQVVEGGDYFRSHSYPRRDNFDKQRGD